MRRKFRVLAGAAILAGGVMIAGCAAPAADPTPTIAPVDEPAQERDADTAATLVLSGAEIGATASVALAESVDGSFEIFCDEGDYEVSVGTQVTCTYADDNGDTPAYVEITAVEGSEYELSVSVP